jgi:hypothetical protein
MRDLSDLRFRILMFLSDDNGYANGELSELLGPDEVNSSTKKKRKSEVHDKGNLSKTLASMIKSKIICAYMGKYYILPSDETFSHIIDQSVKLEHIVFLELFLESIYVNNLIESISLSSTIAAIKGHIINREFRQIAAPALLSHPATIEEYTDLLDSIEGHFKSMEKLKEIKKVGEKFLQDRASGNQPGSAQVRSVMAFQRNLEKYEGAPYDNKIGKIDELETLRELGIDGIRFYRKNLLEDFVAIFAGRMANAENGKPIIKYVEFDNYLSPFTAYPVNYPIELMFSRNFGRLYEDAYLIDPNDLDILLSRANLIFKNFYEFSRIYIGSRPNKDAAIREFVRDWNIACARFETVLYFLAELGYDAENSCFHLASDRAGLQIVDLKTDERLLGKADLEKLEANNLNMGFYWFDQTQFMRPVLLEHIGRGWEKELVPIEAIISKI